VIKPITILGIGDYVMINVLLSILIAAVLLFALLKKFYPQMTVFVITVAVLVVHAFVTNTSILGDDTGGNMYLDIFQYVAAQFGRTFTSNGVLIVTMVGYAAYMRKIKASDKLASLLSEPLKKLKSPYLIVGLTIIISQAMRIAIPSSTGTAALMMGAFYPILVSCGINKLTSAAALSLATGIDIGPAPGSLAIYISNIDDGRTVIDAFRGQLQVYPILIVLMAIVGAVYYWYLDRKNGTLPVKEKGVAVAAEKVDAPVFYALLPLLPVFFAIFFSDMGIGTIIMQVPAAGFFSFLIAFVVEIIRTRKPREVFAASKTMFESMGSTFYTVVVLMSLASVFGTAMAMVGGIDILAKAMVGMRMPFLLTSLTFGALGAIFVVVTANSTATLATLSPAFVAVCKSYGVDQILGGLTFVSSTTLARAIVPISGVNLLVAGTLEVETMDLVKRNLLPTIVLIVLGNIMSQLVFGF